MPELPEVELTAQHLYSHLLGARIDSVEVLRGQSRFLGTKADLLVGRVVSGVYRVGKAIYITIDGGGVVYSHLAMSGLWSSRQSPWTYDYVEAGRTAGDEKHARVVIHTDRCHMVYSDQRLFGRMEFLESVDVQRMPGHGYEFISTERAVFPQVPEDVFCEMVASYDGPIRSFICDQSQVPGVGNIYSAESLTSAGIHPECMCSNLTYGRSAELLCEIQRTLRDAIDRRLDYTGLVIYRRSSCGICGGTDVSVGKMDGRSVYRCGDCQGA